MVLDQLITAVWQYASIFVVILTRIATTFSALTFFTQAVLPSRIMLFFSMALTVFVLLCQPDTLQIQFTYVQFVYNLAMQMFLGFLVAFIMNVYLEIFLGVGQVISMQAGLGFANMIVPRLGSITPLSQFLMITGTLTFFELNGHLVLIKMIIESFQAQFLLWSSFDAQWFIQIAQFTKIIFSGALMLSLSIMISLLLSNTTIAVITKFSPQLNVFTIGINISMLVCFFALYVSFDLILENGKILLNQFLELVYTIEHHGPMP